MALKDWKKTKYKSRSYTMFQNKKEKYRPFNENYYITLGENKLDGGWVSITKQRKQIIHRRFKNYQQALAYSKNYMRKH